MIQTTKFSEFGNGGDLKNSSTTVGLDAGNNVFFNNPWTFLPPGSTAERPAPSSQINYRLRFNTDTQIYEFYNSILGIWQQLVPTSGVELWTVVTTPTQALTVNSGYITNCGSSVVLYTLPVTASIGSVIEIVGTSADGWQVVFGTGQIIRYGTASTTITSGAIESTSRYDSIKLICTVANTDWQITSSVANIRVI